MSKQFPQQLYAAFDESDGEPFIVADGDINGLYVYNDRRKIAVYRLVRTATIVNKHELIEEREAKRNGGTGNR
jgi:hypothetical protein